MLSAAGYFLVGDLPPSVYTGAAAGLPAAGYPLGGELPAPPRFARMRRKRDTLLYPEVLTAVACFPRSPGGKSLNCAEFDGRCRWPVSCFYTLWETPRLA
jgi:hypothetical protein